LSGDDPKLAPIRLVIEGAAPAPSPFRDPQEPHGTRGGHGPPPEEELPPLCPVTALGRDRNTYYFLNDEQQLCELKAKEVVRLEIESLFGRKAYRLEEFWPR